MTYIDGRNTFVQLLGGSSIGKGVNFGINLFLSRILGPAELGLFALIQSTSQTFELLSRAGVDYGLTCALTEPQEGNEKNTDQLMIHAALQVVRYASFFLLFLLLLWLGPGRGLLPEYLTNNRRLFILIVSLVCMSESLSGLPWDILLVQGKVNLVRLRQSLFVPLKLLSALLGAWLGGIVAALTCYAAMATLQAVWLNKRVIVKGQIHKNSALEWEKVKKLVGDGLALYSSNALSAIVFLPLLADIANVSGLQSIGYLRAGQIVVQIFTLIPGALAPVLFIKSRTSHVDSKKNNITEQSLLLIWIFGLATLLAYIAIDKQLISLLFGSDYRNSLQPTRLLVYITILDSVGQILHTALLAKRKIRLFVCVQNSALALSALVGWYSIPRIGLDGFLLSKFIFAGLPALIYLYKSWESIDSKGIIYALIVTSITALPVCWIDSIPLSLEVTLIGIMVALVSFAAIKFKSYLTVQNS